MVDHQTLQDPDRPDINPFVVGQTAGNIAGDEEVSAARIQDHLRLTAPTGAAHSDGHQVVSDVELPVTGGAPMARMLRFAHYPLALLHVGFI